MIRKGESPEINQYNKFLIELEDGEHMGDRALLVAVSPDGKQGVMLGLGDGFRGKLFLVEEKAYPYDPDKDPSDQWPVFKEVISSIPTEFKIFDDGLNDNIVGALQELKEWHKRMAKALNIVAENAYGQYR